MCIVPFDENLFKYVKDNNVEIEKFYSHLYGYTSLMELRLKGMTILSGLLNKNIEILMNNNKINRRILFIIYNIKYIWVDKNYISDIKIL